MSENNIMDISCPHCAAEYHVAAETVDSFGGAFRCNKCKRPFNVYDEQDGAELSEGDRLYAKDASESQPNEPSLPVQDDDFKAQLIDNHLQQLQQPLKQFDEDPPMVFKPLAADSTDSDGDTKNKEKLISDFLLVDEPTKKQPVLPSRNDKKAEQVESKLRKTNSSDKASVDTIQRSIQAVDVAQQPLELDAGIVNSEALTNNSMKQSKVVSPQLPNIEFDDEPKNLLPDATVDSAQMVGVEPLLESSKAENTSTSTDSISMEALKSTEPSVTSAESNTKPSLVSRLGLPLIALSLLGFLLYQIANSPKNFAQVVKCTVVECVPFGSASSHVEVAMSKLMPNPESPKHQTVVVHLVNKTAKVLRLPTVTLSVLDKDGKIVGRRTYARNDYVQIGQSKFVKPGQFRKVELVLANPPVNAHSINVQLFR